MAKGSVRGSRRAARALADAARDIEKASGRATDVEAQDVAAQMRRDAPRDTGELVSSIDVEQDGDAAAVVVRAEHGPFVVFGTSDTPAQDFMSPAAERARQGFPGRVQAEIRKEVG